MNIFIFNKFFQSRLAIGKRKKTKYRLKVEHEILDRGGRDRKQVKTSIALNVCGSRSRQRIVLNKTCVRNLEANEEEIKKSEEMKKDTKEKKRQDHVSGKD